MPTHTNTVPIHTNTVPTHTNIVSSTTSHQSTGDLLYSSLIEMEFSDNFRGSFNDYVNYLMAKICTVILRCLHILI